MMEAVLLCSLFYLVILVFWAVAFRARRRSGQPERRRSWLSILLEGIGLGTVALIVFAAAWEGLEQLRLSRRPDISAEQAMRVALDGIAFDCKDQGRGPTYCHGYKVFDVFPRCDQGWSVAAVSVDGAGVRDVSISRQGDYNYVSWDETPITILDQRFIADAKAGRRLIVQRRTYDDCRSDTSKPDAAPSSAAKVND